MFKRLWRAWPIIMLAALICIHLVIIYYFCSNASVINKTISLISQIIGGLLILYSIDSNIGILREETLISIFFKYLKDFLLKNKSVTVKVTGVESKGVVGNVNPRIIHTPEDIEEKLQYLQKKISDVEKDFKIELGNLNKKIEHQSKMFGVKNKESKTALQDIELKIYEVSIGGIKVQLFGVMLMVYGAISGYIA